MNLPLSPPILPMLAKRVDTIPDGASWIFEPKWDGFRVVIFRDRGELLIQSREGKNLNRYFPELIPPLLQQLPQRCILDGEVVIAKSSGLDFDALQQRIHPAVSRINLLSQRTPASIVFFDLLSIDKLDLRAEPFQRRREQLQIMLANASQPIHLTPSTHDRTIATDWFNRFEGAGLDGVMAKAINGVYESDKRVMLKVKHERDCDCVVGGFRWHKDKRADPGVKAVGSLLLGLYDDAGVLQHVGVCASFTLEKRKELLKYLAPYRKDAATSHPWNQIGGKQAGATNRMPGAKSRWSGGKELEWELLRPELVVEVAYDHMQGDRFRHIAQFRRWRPDKKPPQCTYAQLEVVPPQELKAIFREEVS